jgi:dUTP pyrophosphatase
VFLPQSSIQGYTEQHRMILKIQKIDPTIPEPSYAHAHDAGMDLYARERVVLAPGERAMIATGVAFEIPEGFVGHVWDKSGLSMKHGVKTLGGVIDSGFRGEIMVGMVNLGNTEYVFEKHHKVAQIVIQKVEHPQIEIVATLSDSERGIKGFGSTGK